MNKKRTETLTQMKYFALITELKNIKKIKITLSSNNMKIRANIKD